MAFDAHGTDDPGTATGWGSLAAVGIGMLVLGVVATTHILASTPAAVRLVGMLMVVAGIAQIAVAFRSPGMGLVVP